MVTVKVVLSLVLQRALKEARFPGFLFPNLQTLVREHVGELAPPQIPRPAPSFEAEMAVS